MKAPKPSAGLLIYRLIPGHKDEAEVLLVHPGGPFFVNKDEGSWTIPKGELEAGEDALAAARREVTEETGFAPEGPFEPLGSVTQRGGKVVIAFAVNADFDLKQLVSNRFDLEWPPRSGRRASFPEVDQALYFEIEPAKKKINPVQIELLDRLRNLLRSR